MKILVTGDKGFIGSALVKRLQTEKHEVVGIDTKAEANILTANLPEVDLVIHLAGIGGVRESMNDPKKPSVPQYSLLWPYVSIAPGSSIHLVPHRITSI